MEFIRTHINDMYALVLFGVVLAFGFGIVGAMVIELKKFFKNKG
jgi:hypothetical protein